MKNSTEHIHFENIQNPKAQFDIIKLEDLYRRKNINHSIELQHRVHFYIIIFFNSGKGNHSIDFTDYKCKQGTLLTVRKDQIHKFSFSDNLKGHLLLFTDDFLVSYLEELESQKTMLLFNELLGTPKIQLKKSEFENINESINRIEEEYLKIADNHSLGIIRSELHILISKLFRIKGHKDQFDIKKKYLKEFLEFQKLLEKKVNTTNKVKDYAQMLGLSSKTLNTITKSIVNKTAKEFVDETCIKQIKRLLLNSQLSVKEIAYQTGFEETTNFFKYFKRQTSKTPEQFRESA